MSTRPDPRSLPEPTGRAAPRQRTPHGETEPPGGRLETGRLPADGRLIVPTEAGQTSVRLTVFDPDARLNKIVREVAVVYLE